MKKILVIDGQGGRIGASLISAIREYCASKDKQVEIFAVGTNSIATSNMLKSSPDIAATGENPVIVGCRDTDIIAGPVGIVIVDSLYGEVTPRMAEAVGRSSAIRVLIPVNRCNNVIAGAGEATLASLIREAVEIIARELDK